MNQPTATVSKLQYNTRAQVIVATLVGGLISGCYLIGRNFNAMNDPKQAKQWYVGGIVATILITALYVFLPEKYMHNIQLAINSLSYR